MKQTILICLTSFELGGAERQALNLALLLKKEGIHVVMASFSNKGPVLDACQKYGIKTLEFTNKITPICLFSIAQKIKKYNIDTIFSYCDHANIMMALVFPFTQASRLFWGQRDAGIGYETIKQFPGILSLPTAAISNSIAGKNFLRTISNELKIYHVSNVIQPSPPLFSRTQWRQHLGITEDKKVFLMVANLSRFKAHDLLLHAWALAQASNSFAHKAILLLAGREDDQAEFLHTMVRQLAITNSVIFLGQVSDISGLISAADICVFSSRKEGLPNGILECMYHGLPVIALKNIGTHEACAAVSGNLLISSHTAESLKNGLLNFFDNKDLSSLGERNSLYVKNNFSSENFMKKYISIINSQNNGNQKPSKLISIKCLSNFYLKKIIHKIK